MPKQTFISLFLMMFILLPALIQAQARNELEFPSAQLSEISREYAGSANNWPIVRRLADFDYATNRFFLGPEQVAELRTFLESWNRLQPSRQIYSTMSSRGGQVFAGPEIHQLDSLFTRHRHFISDADIASAIVLADVIIVRVDEVNAIIEERRITEVEAKLEAKTGQVDRRRGLLSEWIGAALGDFFNRSDGIRTGRDSQAQLVFVDGSDVVLYENTMAVIRQSRVDKLTNRSEVEIELSSGGLLTRLTPSAQTDSEYLLNAGTSRSEIRSGNFWAETDDNERVTFANYDGEVTVGASQAQVILRENEGTIVLRGQEPSTPIRLLPPPQLHVFTTDTILYTDNIQLSWVPVSGAQFYEADLSPVRTYDRDVRTRRVNSESIAISDIPEGINYVQIRAFDENNLRGNNSRTLRVLRIASDVPPPVILDNRRQQIVYTFEPTYRLTGTTEPGVRLTIDGQRISVDQHGRFAAELSVPAEKNVLVTAVNNAGITREVRQIIRFVDPDKLFDLQWSVRVDENQIRRAPQILISGEAHQFMNVEITAGEQKYNIPVGSSGRWARQVATGEAGQLIIRFTDKASGETIAEQTFELFSN